jgi:hypothetical protein
MRSNDFLEALRFPNLKDCSEMALWGGRRRDLVDRFRERIEKE